MTHPRAADDFAAIRARMEELRRERAGTPADDETRRESGPNAISDKPRLAGVVRERRLSVAPARLGTFVTAIAAMLIAVNPLGGTAAAATNPTAQFRELVCSMVDGAAAANRLPAGFLARILWQESSSAQ